MLCTCFFCNPTDGIIVPHPTRHKDFEEVTHRLLKSESLDPADSVRRISCMTCGHSEDLIEDNFIKFKRNNEIIFRRII
jgi:methyl coenzyme M reductase gamma subunit